MPIPLERVSIYTANAVKILKEYQKEYQEELSFGADPRRIYEIQRDTKLVYKIVREILRPYVWMLKEIVPEDTLRQLGLI